MWTKLYTNRHNYKQTNESRHNSKANKYRHNYKQTNTETTISKTS